MKLTRVFSLARLSARAGLIAACCMLAGGCKDEPGGPTKASKSAGQGPARDEEILATVGDQSLTVGQLNEQLGAQSPYIRTRYSSVEQKREFLEAMIRFEVLAQEALRRGLDKDPLVILATKNALAQLLVRRTFDEVVLPETITDEEIAAYYQGNLAAYVTEPEVRASGLMLSTKAQADAVTALARQPAHASNEAFAKLVDELSLHATSKARRGDLRYFTQAEAELPAPVVAAAFALPSVGSISDPIKSGEAEYWILRLTDRRPARQKALTEVKQDVRYRIYDERRVAARKALVEQLRTSAKISIDEAALGKVLWSPPTGGPPSPASALAPSSPSSPSAAEPRAPGLAGGASALPATPQPAP